MPFAARLSCCETIDFNSILKYFPRGLLWYIFLKTFGICPTIDRWKIVSTEILPNVLSITVLFLDLPTVNLFLFRTDIEFCFFHYLTPSLKADLNLKQALCTSPIAWSYCFLHHQVSVLYTGLQSQRHTYICTFLVKDACTCIFCFHQTLWNLVLSVCWVLLCIRSWSKKIMLFICENTGIEHFASRYQQI